MSSNPYRNALDSQSACNPLGLTKSLASDIQILKDTEDLDTDKVARHPVMVLYLTQLVFLCHGSMIPDEYSRLGTKWDEAHRACEAMAKQWDENRIGTPTSGPVTISQVAHGGLHAANLASILFVDDEAHRTIQSHAQKLLSQGKGTFRYLNRYPNGATAWRDPNCAFTGGIVNVEPEALGLSLVKEVADVPSGT